MSRLKGSENRQAIARRLLPVVVTAEDLEPKIHKRKLLKSETRTSKFSRILSSGPEAEGTLRTAAAKLFSRLS